MNPFHLDAGDVPGESWAQSKLGCKGLLSGLLLDSQEDTQGELLLSTNEARLPIPAMPLGTAEKKEK